MEERDRVLRSTDEGRAESRGTRTNHITYHTYPIWGPLLYTPKSLEGLRLLKF